MSRAEAEAEQAEGSPNYCYYYYYYLAESNCLISLSLARHPRRHFLLLLLLVRLVVGVASGRLPSAPLGSVVLKQISPLRNDADADNNNSNNDDDKCSSCRQQCGFEQRTHLATCASSAPAHAQRSRAAAQGLGRRLGAPSWGPPSSSTTGTLSAGRQSDIWIQMSTSSRPRRPPELLLVELGLRGLKLERPDESGKRPATGLRERGRK